MTACKNCDKEIGLEIEVRCEIVEYPHNPEWPLTRTDAAVCCSTGCLIEYLKGDVTQKEAVLDMLRSPDKTCPERWPDCEAGSYDPRCCRFSKECSA